MKFSEKVRKLRKEKKINQETLANLLGVSKRTVQNYEISDMYPKKREIYYKLAEIFEVDVNYLLTENEELLINAYEKGGTVAMREVDKLINKVCALFAGGNMPSEDMDAAMKAISDAYFAVKTENAKYTASKNKEIN